MSTTEKERSKYERIWEFPAYSEISPGAIWVEMFQNIAKPRLDEWVLDVGAGSGAASRVLKDDVGLNVVAFDITDKAWTYDDIEFVQGCLWKGLPILRDPIECDGDAIWDYTYCCDVMEHIPTEFVGLSIRNMLHAAHYCFFSISFLPDSMGKLIDEQLHLTVKPFTWWRDVFKELGTVLEARDMMGHGVFYVRGR